MRAIFTYGTQEDILTPQFEPGVDFATIQLQDDDGRPISDVHMLPITGDADIYLLPLLIMGVRDSFPRLVALFQKAIRFAAVNGGRFDERQFVDSTHAELHKPLPSPIIPQPVPVVVSPAPGSTLTAALAQVTIDAYARGHNIGSATGDAVFALPQVIGGGYGRNYSGGGDTNGICIVVCSMLNSKPYAFLVRNAFFANYAAAHYDNRALLGAPTEDERSVSGGAEQRFQKGRMFWRQATNAVEVYDLQGKRIN